MTEEEINELTIDELRQQLKIFERNFDKVNDILKEAEGDTIPHPTQWCTRVVETSYLERIEKWLWKDL